MSHIKYTERGDTFRIMFDSLVRWRNLHECSGENSGSLLEYLLERFKKDSIIASYHGSVRPDHVPTANRKTDQSQSKHSLSKSSRTSSSREATF